MIPHLTLSQLCGSRPSGRLPQAGGILDCVTAGDALIVAGWVLVREVDTPAPLGTTLAPRLMTISDCIQDDLPRPDPWLGDWFQDKIEATKAAARARGERPLVVTVAMSQRDATAFVDEWEEPAVWFDLLRRGEPLPLGAQVLGYEVVGAEEALDFHSWHCHAYADDAQEALDISVNRFGLIPSLEQARAVLTWMLGLPDAEAPAPVPWTVVALASSA